MTLPILAFRQAERYAGLAFVWFSKHVSRQETHGCESHTAGKAEASEVLHVSKYLECVETVHIRHV